MVGCRTANFSVAATDIVSRDATNEEGELADLDMLAATEEAEAAHHADEVRTRSGAGPVDSSGRGRGGVGEWRDGEPSAASGTGGFRGA